MHTISNRVLVACAVLSSLKDIVANPLTDLLHVRTWCSRMDTSLLSFVERLSSFRGYFE